MSTYLEAFMIVRKGSSEFERERPADAAEA